MKCMPSHSAGAIVVLGLTLAANLLPHPAAAGFESNDALFLAPSQVPKPSIPTTSSASPRLSPTRRPILTPLPK
jgi:hypothetical protein